MEFLLATLIVFSIAYFGGKALASGSEQKVYDAYTAKDSTMTDGQYEAAITAPPVEQKPWVPIYRDCTPCDCGSCGSVKLQWLLFGAVLIAGIFGLHFMLV